MMTDEEIDAVLSEFEIRGSHDGSMEINFERGGDGNVELILSHYTFDSRDDENWQETSKDFLDSATQTFTRMLDKHELAGAVELCQVVLEMVAQAMAHEALEWTRYKGVMIHDPHVDGDVHVRIIF